MFMARGWHSKARKTLGNGLLKFPENRILSDLYDQASEPATEPDYSDADVSNFAAGIAAAKHFMAGGALVRARAILDRLQRSHPAEDLVTDLLWALEGDFGLQGDTLQHLVRQHGTALQSLPDLPEDPDHTETAHVDDVALPDEVGAFPTLFRNLEPQTEYFGSSRDGDDEVTHVSAMASLGELQEKAPEVRDTDPGELLPASEVTQIQMVVRKDGAMEEDNATETQQSIFDLATLPPFPTSDFDVGPEQEDADVVIHTRVAEELDDADVVTQVGPAPLSFEPTPKPLRQLDDEASSWVKPLQPPVPEEVGEETEAPTVTPSPVKKRARSRMRRWPVHVAALIGVALVAALIVIVVLAISFVASWF